MKKCYTKNYDQLEVYKLFPEKFDSILRSYPDLDLTYINETFVKYGYNDKNNSPEKYVSVLIDQETDRINHINDRLVIERDRAVKSGEKFNPLMYRNRKKVIAEKDDPAYIHVKCSNPKCNHYYLVNLYELIYGKKMFCSSYCRVSVHRMIPKPQKYKLSCSKCNNIFYSLDPNTKYCSTWCEFFPTKLTPKNYKTHIETINNVKMRIKTFNGEEALQKYEEEFKDDTYIRNLIKIYTDLKTNVNKEKEQIKKSRGRPKKVKLNPIINMVDEKGNDILSNKTIDKNIDSTQKVRKRRTKAEIEEDNRIKEYNIGKRNVDLLGFKKYDPNNPYFGGEFILYENMTEEQLNKSKKYGIPEPEILDDEYYCHDD